MTKALKITPMLRQYLELKDRYADAFIVWKDLVTRDPTSVPALRQLISCLAKMKRFGMATGILEKAVRFLKKVVEYIEEPEEMLLEM